MKDLRYGLTNHSFLTVLFPLLHLFLFSVIFIEKNIANIILSLNLISLQTLKTLSAWISIHDRCNSTCPVWIYLWSIHLLMIYY